MFVAYLLIVFAVAILVQESLILLALILFVNVFLVFWLGTTAIRSLVFPYSLWLIKDGVNGSNNIKYASDFASLVERSYVILRSLTETDDKSKLQPALDLIKDKIFFESTRKHYSTREISNKMLSVLELIILYSETNTTVLKGASPLLREMTHVLLELQKVLD